MDIDKQQLISLIKEANSKSDICRALKLPTNGTGMRKVGNLIKDYDTSHFGKRPDKVKYPIVRDICPVCYAPFVKRLGSPKEKKTCSYSCSNTFFRSGEDNGNFGRFGTNPDSIHHYKRICFDNHKKECIISGCGENRIVEVHHYDEDHSNNFPENLVPLCPTHHRYWHSGYKNLIEDEVHNYVKNYINKIDV